MVRYLDDLTASDSKFAEIWFQIDLSDDSHMILHLFEDHLLESQPFWSHVENHPAYMCLYWNRLN